MTSNVTRHPSIRHELSRLVARLTEVILPAEMVSRMREGREWKGWIDRLDGSSFQDLANAQQSEKRLLFKRHVTLVEIEVHAKCNRVCSFCPNAIVDRRRNNVVTDVEVLDQLFRDLGSIDYRGQIKIARYSEPLTNLAYLYDRIRAARRLVPNAQLAIVTNTDYLKPETLDALRAAGLDRVYMSIYFKSNERWSRELARECVHRATRAVAKLEPTAGPLAGLARYSVERLT